MEQQKLICLEIALQDANTEGLLGTWNTIYRACNQCTQHLVMHKYWLLAPKCLQSTAVKHDTRDKKDAR